MPSRSHRTLMKRLVEPIQTAVRTGDFTEDYAKQFAQLLHEDVGGKFIHRMRQRNFNFNEWAVDTIVDDWLKKEAHQLSQEQIVDKICGAMQHIGDESLSSEVRQQWQRPSNETIEQSEINLLPQGSDEQANGVWEDFVDHYWYQKPNKNRVVCCVLLSILSLIFIIVGVFLGKPIWTSVIQYTGTSCSNEDMRSRTIKIVKGQVKEFDSCVEVQSPILDFPVHLNGSVGIYTRELGVVVCGGKGVVNPNSNQPKLCYTHKLGSDEWVELPFQLNTNRIGSYMKRSGNKIIIFGGISSDINFDCYPSLEQLDLVKLSDETYQGWNEEKTEEEECFQMQVASENPLSIDIPCQSC